MKIIVIGAGVIGVTTAYFLARDGHEVVVLEKNSAAGLGCSYANGGQLSYSNSGAIASKSLLLQALKSLFCRSSFLSFGNFFDKEFLPWLYQFLRNCPSSKESANHKKLLQLGAYSKKVMEEILKEETSLEFDHQKSGILYFFRKEKSFIEAVHKAEVDKSLGCKVKILTKEECVAKEPILIKLYDEQKLAGGLFYENDASGNSYKFTTSLEQICREKYGVVFEYDAEVKNIFTNYKKVTGINTGKGVFTADKYVCTLGSYGNKLLRGIGLNTKIYPIKGYSISANVSEKFVAPKMAMTDLENRIVYSRIGNVFRVAGAAEINGFRTKQNGKLVSFLNFCVKSTFSDFGTLDEQSEWFGFRPCRPNSIPLVCEVSKYGNLLLNMGHGFLGWTLSAASGKITADLISKKTVKRSSNPAGFLSDEEKTIYRT